MPDWCDRLVTGITGPQVTALRTTWKLSVPQFALLLGIHHSSVYRWEKSAKAPPIERYSRRVLAVLHVLRKDAEAKTKVCALLRQQRDIEALHLIFTYATKHQEVLMGEVEAPVLPEARRKPELRAEPQRIVLPPVLRSDEEDEGEQVEEDEGEEHEGARAPEVPCDHLLEVLLWGKWCSYGRHTEEMAKSMSRHHLAKSRQVRLTKVEVVPSLEPDEGSAQAEEVRK